MKPVSLPELRDRPALEQAELDSLAPWAQTARASLGRVHEQPHSPFRTCFQRDAARITHCAAFRRLEYKTQVFLNGTGDHYRTRLTHTMEVASVSRTIARALGLNEDLAEAVALAHDLGHSPFGHCGEQTLNGLLKDHGGFNHNAQSLRVVEVLESPYPDFSGLNLSFEVLEGLRKHDRTRQGPPGSGLDTYHQATLEGQIADLADEIAYHAHDLQDGLESGLIDPAGLAEVELCATVTAQIGLPPGELAHRTGVHRLTRRLINHLFEDVIRTSAEAIREARPGSVNEVRRHPVRLVRYSPETASAARGLRRFLYENLYFHPTVAGANQRACSLLEQVFQAYLQKPELLGREAARRIPTDGLHRAAADYIAGMTDRYLLAEHRRLFGNS